MTSQDNGASPSAYLLPSSRTPLAQLSPQTSADAQIEAVIALVWPFSSSTSTLSLLLAEPDVQLRKSKGQVKVTFHGRGARDVAKSQAGIGDTIKLSLLGAKWIHTGDVTATPGKKVDWDLDFERRVELKIERPGQDPIVVEQREVEQHDAATQHIMDFKTSIGNVVSVATNGSPGQGFSSPAFAKAHRQSGHSFVDASLDPFATDDGFVVGKGRKRTKFARPSGSWRLVSSPSPPFSPEHAEGSEQQQKIGDVEETLRSPNHAAPELDLPEDGVQDEPATKLAAAEPDAAAVEDNHSSSGDTEPFTPEEMHGVLLGGETGTSLDTIPTPPAETSLGHNPSKTNAGERQDDAVAQTPRLHPLPSHGLQLVSPFVFKDTGDHFRTSAIIRSESGKRQASSDIEEDVLEVGEFSTSTSEEQKREQGNSLDVPADEVAADSDEYQPLEPYGSPGVLRQPNSYVQEPQQAFVDLSESTSEPDEIDARNVDQLEAVQQTDTQPDDEESPDKTSPVVAQMESDMERVANDQQISMPQPLTTSKFGYDMYDSHGTGSGTNSESEDHSFPRDMAIMEVDTLMDNELNEEPGELLSTQPPGSEADKDEIVDVPAEDGDSEPDVSNTAVGSISPDNLRSAEEHVRQLPLAPEDTQQELVEDIADSRESHPSNQGLPSPQNPQKPVRSDIGQVDGQTAESTERETGDKRPESVTQTVDTPARSTRRSTRMSQPPQISPEPASSYFTLRRPAKSITAQRATPPPSQDDSVREQQRGDTVHDLRSRKVKDGPEEAVVYEQYPIKRRTPATTRAPAPEAEAEARERTAGLLTPLTYFVELASLSEYFNQTVDAFAVSTSRTSMKSAQRAKSGPQDYYATLHLADKSLPAPNTVTAQIFRPYKSAIPSVKRGDVVLLRNFKVQSQKRKCALLSTESSAWAVFNHTQTSGSNEDVLQADMSGPPVEHGHAEHRRGVELTSWWLMEGENAHPEATPKPPKPRIPNFEVLTNGDEQDLMTPRRSRRLQSQPPGETSATTTDRVAGRQPPSSSPPQPSTTKKRRRSEASAMSRPARKTAGTRMSEGVVHELRDGTEYVFDDDATTLSSSVRKEGDVLVHELRDGLTYTDEK